MRAPAQARSALATCREVLDDFARRVDQTETAIPDAREHVSATDVITFLASAGSLVLTFLAGG